MNDVLAMAVFREHERREARLNAAVSETPLPLSPARSPRERLAAVLLALAVRLAPVETGAAELPRDAHLAAHA